MTIDLNTLREEISTIDEQLLSLVAKRQKCTTMVAETKILQHKNVRDEAREEALLVNLVKKGQKLGLSPQFVTALFHTIIEDSVLNQQALLAERANPENIRPLHRVAYLGDKGSYSYLATQKYFSRRPGELLEIGCQSFAEIIQKVESNEADFAVLPIENTSSGSINEVYDQLQHSSIAIVGELTHPVRHSVLTVEESDLSNIKVLYGHPQVFAQCSQFISQLGDIKKHLCDSTSHAMQLVSESQRFDIAALGSAEGGKVYGLNAVRNNIANQQENHSRFIVIARKAAKVPLQIPAKTTIVMSTVQKPGALVEALLVFKENEINMTKLESRPINGNPWEEMFYIDVDGNIDDGPMEKAIETLRGMTRYLKILGCYPSESIKNTKVPMVQALQNPDVDEG
ncbi:MAG: prephenate dehydratase [Aestuariibacter sp.]